MNMLQVPAAKGKEGKSFFPRLLAMNQNKHDKNISFRYLQIEANESEFIAIQ